MASLLETPRCFQSILRGKTAWRSCLSTRSFQRHTSTSTSTSAATLNIADTLDVESDSGLMMPVIEREGISIESPRKRAQRRGTYELPPSRYKYHPPKYDRGPLHPVQPPPKTDPQARNFSPGPFNLPRLAHTWDSTISEDILTMCYQHKEPGTEKRFERIRLRPWDDSSPYMKNRPVRGPRGPRGLYKLEKGINYHNIPKILHIHIACFQPLAGKNWDHMQVMRGILHTITGVRPIATHNRVSVANWHTIAGERTGAKVMVTREQAWEFIDKCINHVFPKIKDWRGLKASTGDGSGNLAFGLTPTEMLYFPEVEANYSMYPAKMIPGCRVVIRTSATSDRQAMLLSSALGIPFYEN